MLDDQNMVSGYIVSTEPNGNCVYESTLLGASQDTGINDQACINILKTFSK